LEIFQSTFYSFNKAIRYQSSQATQVYLATFENDFKLYIHTSVPFHKISVLHIRNYSLFRSDDATRNRSYYLETKKFIKAQ